MKDHPLRMAIVAGLVSLALFVFVLAPLIFPKPGNPMLGELDTIDELEQGLRSHGLTVSPEAKHRTTLRLVGLPISLAVAFGVFVHLRRKQLTEE
ncbi:MAG: hypothetical protein P9M14_00230 [Candidatus Alcyoniella australis]|nr:hypothetical protein [Candidatus Alcyoniella australis]